MTDSAPRLWDLFCRVIDNHGDLGVCWRLARDLAARGHAVRLWVDDPSALAWMAPGVDLGKPPDPNPAPGAVSVLPWAQPIAPDLLAALQPADVWVEAFGCEMASEFIATRAYQSSAGGQNDAQLGPPTWINLEYLSAEPYVERMHGLPSPVLHGPAAGWTKWFFYPGFTPHTGGLLRERDLAERQATHDRGVWLQQHGLAWQGEPLVSLFCYEPLALGDWLAQLRHAPMATRLLATAGRATQAMKSAMAAMVPADQSGVKNSNKNSLQRFPDIHQQLSISYLPHVPQTEYDRLLWSCDLNFVRGEDSLVRALWAGAPLVWHIYPQHDDAHHAKLEAFLQWLRAPASLATFHRVWNGLQPGPLPTIDLARDLPEWCACLQAARQRLLAQDDLATQLLRFIGAKTL